MSPEVGMTFLLGINGKDEKDDLTVVEKKALKALAESYKREVIRGAGKGRPKRGELP